MTRLLYGIVLALLLTSPSECAAIEVEVIPLWTRGAPGFENRRDEQELAEDYWVRNIHNPSLTVFLPVTEKATRTAVLVIPGGGHKELVFQAEGVEPAKYLQQLGVAAFVLKYRLAREKDSPYDLRKHPREDAQRAIRLVRSRAAEWNIDPQRVGVLGFSAGGEVAAQIAYDSGEGDPHAADPIDRQSARPDFQMLIYPGPLGIPDQVPADAPPAFLLAANDDLGCSPNVMRLLELYRQAGVPVEAHIYSHGGHAFNMGQRSELKSVRDWPERMSDWLSDNGYLEHAPPQRP